ncbi:MAG: hypothetical protein H6674_07460 [Dehalococcoidia bacterium]|nr:hypothetical protein [Dehalococcoidia bacterium]
MVEAFVALGLGGVLGFLLGGPKLSAGQRAPKATVAATAAQARTPASSRAATATSAAPPAGTPAPSGGAPRKATQTAQKFK